MNHRNDGVPAQHWLLKSLFVVVAAAAAEKLRTKSVSFLPLFCLLSHSWLCVIFPFFNFSVSFFLISYFYPVLFYSIV